MAIRSGRNAVVRRLLFTALLTAGATVLPGQAWAQRDEPGEPGEPDGPPPTTTPPPPPSEERDSRPPPPPPPPPVFQLINRNYDAGVAEAARSSAEFQGVLLSPDRQAIIANMGDATGARHPFERANVHVAYGFGLSGAGTIIAINDSGFNLVNGVAVHQDFDDAGKLTLLPDSPPLVSDSHGIHVSGLALAERDGLVMHGVAYGATLLVTMGPTSPGAFGSFYDAFRARGVLASSNSYGIPTNDRDGVASAWGGIKTAGTFEVTARNAIAFRDRAGLTNQQMMAQIIGGDWLPAVASILAFQQNGGIVVWANSNYGLNDIANGRPGLDDADLFAGLPLVFPELAGSWITVVNATSVGLARQINGDGYVDAPNTWQQSGIFLMSAPCGAARNFCLSMDGSGLWSGSNRGPSTYESQTGTSQATPMVSGMLALLREAFPTASSADLTARLLFTANNSNLLDRNREGATGVASYTNANGTITHAVSDIWGHGFPDLSRALQPVGTPQTVNAGGVATKVDRIVSRIVAAPALGDAARQLAQQRYLLSDQLNGVFSTPLTVQVVSPAANILVGGAVDARALSLSTSAVSTGRRGRVAFGEARRVSDTTGDRPGGALFSFSAGLGEIGVVRFGYGYNPANHLGIAASDGGIAEASLTGRAFLNPIVATGGDRQLFSMATFGASNVRVTVGAFRGTMDEPDLLLQPGTTAPRRDEPGATGMIAEASVALQPGLEVHLGYGRMVEDRSFLGSFSTGLAGVQGATTDYLSFGARARLSPSVSVRLSYTSAFTTASGLETGFTTGTDALRSDAMALGLAVNDVGLAGGQLSFSVSQPLRVASGGIRLQLPTGVSIRAPGDFSFTYEDVAIGLAPSGRQLDFSAEYAVPLNGRTQFSLGGLMVRDAGHVRGAELQYGGVASFRIAW